MKNIKLSLVLAALFTFVGVCCKKEDVTPIAPEPEPAVEKFFIAAEQGEGTYMLTVDDLAAAETITTINNGIENPLSYTHYAYNGTQAVMGISYRQGNPAVGVIYGLDERGELVKTGNDFELTDGFSNIGNVGNFIVTSRSGRTLTDGSTGAAFYFIDLEDGNYITQKTLTTEDFAGHGLTANFIGIVDAGNGEFLTGVELVDGTVDSVFVAKFDSDLNLIQLYEDDRLSRSGGQWRSARYSQMGNDDEGNTYVFSGAYSTETTKPAGALRIPQGASDFDDSYFFNIEAQSGGYRFRKVWHITEDYFLLEFYNELEYTSNTPATQYAVVGMENQSFSWVSGLPDKDNIGDAGWPYASNGKAYFPITDVNEQPTVYVIDPATATAVKGIVVDGAASISGVAKLTVPVE